jgi:hypothetical protein
VFLLE